MATRLVTLCLAAALVAACSTPATPVSVSGGTVQAGATARPTVTLTGTVTAPTGIVAAALPVGGGNLIPAGGGNALPVGGGNVISTGGGSLRSLQSLDAAPLANARVTLADASGTAYEGVSPVTTDAAGAYTFTGVPSDYTLMVLVSAHDSARGKDVQLRTLVRSGEGASAPVDLASSLVTIAVTKGAAALGDYDADNFQGAVEATRGKLVTGDLPDLSDATAVAARVEGYAPDGTPLRQQLDRVRERLGDGQGPPPAQVGVDFGGRPPASPTPTGARPSVAPAGQPTPGGTAAPAGQPTPIGQGLPALLPTPVGTLRPVLQPTPAGQPTSGAQQPPPPQGQQPPPAEPF